MWQFSANTHRAPPEIWLPTTTLLHAAVAHQDVLRRRREATPVRIATGVHRDAIVAGVESAVFDEHVIHGFRIDPIIVRTVAEYIDAAQRDVPA